MSGHTFDAEYLQAQYELLRREALEASPHAPRGHGLLLFLRRGMVAWAEVASCLSGRRAAPAQATAPPLPLSLRPEVTTVLANMVLVCMQEVPA